MSTLHVVRFNEARRHGMGKWRSGTMFWSSMCLALCSAMFFVLFLLEVFLFCARDKLSILSQLRGTNRTTNCTSSASGCKNLLSLCIPQAERMRMIGMKTSGVQYNHVRRLHSSLFVFGWRPGSFSSKLPGSFLSKQWHV